MKRWISDTLKLVNQKYYESKLIRIKPITIHHFRRVVTQESNRLEIAPRPPVALTNAVSWRPEGVKHRKNEIFLDVIEKVNILVASNGTVLHCDILGSILMKSFLSGMPELKLGLNDKLMFEMTGRSNTRIKVISITI